MVRAGQTLATGGTMLEAVSVGRESRDVPSGARANYGAGTQAQQSGQTGFASTYPSGHCAQTTCLQF